MLRLCCWLILSYPCLLVIGQSSQHGCFTQAVIIYDAGAHRTWFHLYRLVLEQPQEPPEAQPEEAAHQQVQQVALAVEQFLQTSTVGEYDRRLNMVWSFRCASALLHTASGNTILTYQV